MEALTIRSAQTFQIEKDKLEIYEDTKKPEQIKIFSLFPQVTVSNASNWIPSEKEKMEVYALDLLSVSALMFTAQ